MSGEEGPVWEWPKQKILIGLSQRDVNAFYSLFCQRSEYNVQEKLEINLIKYLLSHGEMYMREHAAESLGEDYYHREDMLETLIYFSQREDDEDVLIQLVSGLFWSFTFHEDITSMRAIFDVFRKGGTKVRQYILERLIYHMNDGEISGEDSWEFLINCLTINTNENDKKFITDVIGKMCQKQDFLEKRFEQFFNDEQENENGLTPKYSQSQTGQIKNGLELNIADSVLTDCQLHFNINM